MKELPELEVLEALNDLESKSIGCAILKMIILSKLEKTIRIF